MRLAHWLLLLTLTAALTIGSGAQEPKPLVRILLRERATVNVPTITLGSIADILPLTEMSDEQVAALASLPVAPAPLPRYSRTITAGEVATKLAQMGWRNGSFVLEGATKVLVTRIGRQVTAAELEAALHKALGVPVKLLLPPPPLLVPSGELSVQALLPSSPRTTLPVTVLVDGRPVATVRLLVQAVVPPAKTEGFSSSEPNVGNRNNLVQRRQTVRLVVRVNRVVVEAQGTALQDGKLGDEVLVAVAWSKTPLKGVVTGEREVTIPTW